MLHTADVSTAWLLITRLGEATLLLPMAAALSLWLLWRRHAWPLVPSWFAAMAAAALLTLVTKLAFIGWGIGSARLDFTGISGHAMCAAAVLPPLLGFTASQAARPWPLLAWLLGVALAALVAVSRLAIDVHSPSEVLAGFALGMAVSAAMAAAVRWRRRPPSAPLWLPALMLLWFTGTPATAPAVDTHGAVTRLALVLSGRDQPYTRAELLARRPQ